MLMKIIQLETGGLKALIRKPQLPSVTGNELVLYWIIDSPTLTLLCGRHSVDYSFKSTSNAIFIHFVSDGYLEFRGFKILYHALPYGIHDEIEVAKESEDEDIEEAENIEEEDDDEFENDIAEWIHETDDNSTIPLNPTPPHFIIKQPQNATVSEGHSHLLECHVNVTNPSIVWYVNIEFKKNRNNWNQVVLGNNGARNVPLKNQEHQGHLRLLSPRRR